MREVILVKANAKRKVMEEIENVIRNQQESGNVQKIQFKFRHESKQNKKNRNKQISKITRKIIMLQEAIQNVKTQVPSEKPLIPALSDAMAEAEIMMIQLQHQLYQMLYYDIIIDTSKRTIIVPFMIDLKKDSNMIQYLLSICGMVTNDCLKKMKICQCIGGTYIMYKNKAPQKQILKIS